MVKDEHFFKLPPDTETLVQLIARSKRVKTIDKIIDAIFQVHGRYALTIMTE